MSSIIIIVLQVLILITLHDVERKLNKGLKKPHKEERLEHIPLPFPLCDYKVLTERREQ